MYNLSDVRATVHTPYLLLALLVAAFITFYPQLEAAGYCGSGSCPEVSYSAHASTSGGFVASGASFVVAVIVAIPAVTFVRGVRLARSAPPPALVGITLPPDTPPPRSSV
jgi:hypothetical protein